MGGANLEADAFAELVNAANDKSGSAPFAAGL